MFEFLQRIGGKVAAWFSPPYDPSRREAMGMGVVTAAKVAATGNIEAAAATTGFDLKEHLQLLKVIDRLAELKGEEDTARIGREFHELDNSSYPNQDRIDNHKDILKEQTEWAKKQRKDYQDALEQLKPFAEKGFAIPMADVRKGAGLKHFFSPQETTLTPQFLAEKYPPNLLDNMVEMAIESVEKDYAWARQWMRLRDSLQKLGFPAEENYLPTGIIENIKKRIGKVALSAQDFQHIVENATQEQLRTLPSYYAEYVEQQQKYEAVERSLKKQREFGLDSQQNTNAFVSKNLSELFGGMEFRQRKDDTLIVYAKVQTPWGSETEFTRAVQNLLQLAGVNENLPTRETLFKEFGGNPERELRMGVNMPSHLYIELQPEHALALAEFHKTQKPLLERAQNMNGKLGALSSAIETLQSFGRGLATNSFSR